MGVEHNARQVEKWLSTHAALVGPGSRPEEPMGGKHRGGSRTPATEKLERFNEANTVAASYITPKTKEVWRSSAEYGGIRFWELLNELYRNPAIVRTWKAEATTEDAREHEAFEKMCRFIADLIRAEYPNVSLNVTVNPRDEPLVREGKPHHRKRRITVEDTYRKRYERLREIEEREKCSRSAAVGMLADYYEVGVASIWRAIEFAEKEAS